MRHEKRYHQYVNTIAKYRIKFLGERKHTHTHRSKEVKRTGERKKYVTEHERLFVFLVNLKHNWIYCIAVLYKIALIVKVYPNIWSTVNAKWSHTVTKTLTLCYTVLVLLSQEQASNMFCSKDDCEQGIFMQAHSVVLTSLGEKCHKLRKYIIIHKVAKEEY